MDADTARRQHDLTPTMERALLAALRLDGVLPGDRRTEHALIRRGLADEVRGQDERPNYRYTGVRGRTTTVYDAYLGARLTDEGLRVARALKT